MKTQTTIVLVLISVVVAMCVSLRLKNTQKQTMTNLGRSVKVKSASFHHQVADFVEVDGSRIQGVQPRGRGLTAVVMKRIHNAPNKVEAKSFHVGVLKIDKFESRLVDMKSFIETEKNKGAGILILFSVGTTHDKSVLEEIRRGLLAGEYPEAKEVLKMYGMKKFLSMAHGCRQPYILIHDLKTSKNVSERTGICGGVLCAKA